MTVPWRSQNSRAAAGSVVISVGGVARPTAWRIAAWYGLEPLLAIADGRLNTRAPVCSVHDHSAVSTAATRAAASAPASATSGSLRASYWRRYTAPTPSSEIDSPRTVTVPPRVG